MPPDTTRAVRTGCRWWAADMAVAAHAAPRAAPQNEVGGVAGDLKALSGGSQESLGPEQRLSV